MNERREMVQPCDKVSITRQCGLLSLNRSTFYYEAAGESEENLRLMREIDELHLKHPYYGERRIAVTLSNQKGIAINRKRVQRLMRLMGIYGIAPGPTTSRAHPEHEKYPYLLKNLSIERPNQVWATDLTYIPLARGFGYLVAIMDLYSRAVLAWGLSNTMMVDFCVEILSEALMRYPAPDIFNSDQGSQFTSVDFTSKLKARGIRISMDGKGRCHDNIFIERLWRSLKYEEVYMKAYNDLRDARSSIGKWLDFYNQERVHQSLKYCTPFSVYFGKKFAA